MSAPMAKQRVRDVMASVSDRVLQQPWSNPLLFAIAGGVAAVIAFGAQRDQPVTAVAVGLLVAGAALPVGPAIGFLFALPPPLHDPPHAPRPPAHFPPPPHAHPNPH